MLRFQFCRNRFVCFLRALSTEDQRESDLDQQTFSVPIECRHSATVKAHSSLRNCQAEPDAARESSASIIQSVERLKELSQSVRWNTWAPSH